MKKILQVFKKFFKKQPNYAGRAYICDPSKNHECVKDGCWYTTKGPCKCTLKKKYAQLDENKKPIKATEDDLFNLEWMEQQIPVTIPMQELHKQIEALKR